MISSMRIIYLLVKSFIYHGFETSGIKVYDVKGNNSFVHFADTVLQYENYLIVKNVNLQ